MSKKLEECAKAKSQLKVTDLFSSAEGSESEGTNIQYTKMKRKRRQEPTGDNINNNKSYPPTQKTNKLKNSIPKSKTQNDIHPESYRRPPP